MAKKIYVGNLSYNTSEEELRDLFAQYGTVVSANIIIDRETRRPKGFGFVEMQEDAAADAAISSLMARKLEVAIFVSTKQLPSPGRRMEVIATK